MILPFSPGNARTVSITVAATTGNVKIQDTPGPLQVLVTNDGTATVWINFDKSSTVTAAAASGTPIGPGVAQVFTVAVGDGPIYAAAIAAGATGKVYFTPGTGL